MARNGSIVILTRSFRANEKTHQPISGSVGATGDENDICCVVGLWVESFFVVVGREVSWGVEINKPFLGCFHAGKKQEEGRREGGLSQTHFIHVREQDVVAFSFSSAANE
jgi:hypothetical protein